MEKQLQVWALIGFYFFPILIHGIKLIPVRGRFDVDTKIIRLRAMQIHYRTLYNINVTSGTCNVLYSSSVFYLSPVASNFSTPLFLLLD